MKLPSEVANDKLQTPAYIGDVREAIWITNGSLVYAVVPQKHQRTKHVLWDRVTNNPKMINQEIARRLAELGPVNTLFSLDVWQNAVFIPYVTDMVSLADILAIRESWSFKQEHVHILVDDVSAFSHFAHIALTIADTHRPIQSTRSRTAEGYIITWRHNACTTARLVIFPDW